MPNGIPSSPLTVANLRQYLGEVIPAGGTEADTMFTDAQLTQLIADVGGDWGSALSEGWAIKAANYAGLVDSAEGTSKRSFSDLHKHALDMVGAYGPGGVAGSGQAVIYKINRR